MEVPVIIVGMNPARERNSKKNALSRLYNWLDELNLDYAGAPPALKKHMGPQVRERVTDLATGKIIKGEAPSLTLREKLEAAKKKGK